jgi:hypothetical protein
MRRDMILSESRRVWYLIFICLALATVALGSLVLSYRSSENAILANQRANAAEFRSAKNTILNCVHLNKLDAVAKKLGTDLPPEPFCDPYEVDQLREYVKLFQWIEARKPEMLKK